MAFRKLPIAKREAPRFTILGVILGGAALASSSGCTLHHVRDERPVPTRIDGLPATIQVERAPAHFGGQRLLVTVEHPDTIDIDNDLGAAAALTTPAGAAIDTCFRESLTRDDMALEGRRGWRRSQVRFRCRYPLTQPVALATGNDYLPVLGPGGLEVIGRRPWLLSGWARGELSIPTATTGAGVDLGVNLGLRGLVREHMHLGGRADLLANTQQGRGQALFGPEIGYVHSTWPCARCSVEATVSYLLGYNGGFAHGPEADVHMGVRVARTGTLWHGIEAGVGYRYLVGPDVSGSVVMTISYSLMAALRGAPLPASLRARPTQLIAEEDTPQEAAPPRPLPEDGP